MNKNIKNLYHKKMELEEVYIPMFIDEPMALDSLKKELKEINLLIKDFEDSLPLP